MFGGITHLENKTANLHTEGMTMLRTIEQSATHLVQKVMNPKGETLAYQAVPKSSVGDSSAITRCSRLFEARKLAGIVYSPPQK